MNFKLVLRYDPTMRILRLFRVTTRGVYGIPDDPETRPSRKWSLALRCYPTWMPLRFRYDKSWGGSFG
jgi:hypothetical protein